MVGRESPASPRRWPSGHMRGSEHGACRERHCVGRGRREGGERGRGPRGDLAQSGAGRRGSHDREQRRRSHGVGPPPQARPASRGRSSDKPPWADAPPDFHGGETIHTPERERQRDGGSRVEAAPQDPARHNPEDRAAALAGVAAAEDLADRRRRRRVRGAPLVAGTQSVAMQGKLPARWPARHAAARAPRWPHLLRRGEACGPGLDVELRVDDSKGALASRQPWSGHDGVRVASTPPSPVSGAGSMPVPRLRAPDYHHLR
jgi:hypothetical protein